MKTYLLETPSADEHSAQTREIKLPATLVAKLMEAQELAEREEESSKQTERRRRRANLTTLSRDNPFVTPTPLAPWLVTDIAPRADDVHERDTVRDSSMRPIHRAEAKIPAPDAAAAAAAMADADERPLLEVVVAVWTLMVALALAAQHFFH